MSKPLRLDQNDLKKILKGSAMAFAGGAVVQINLFISSGILFDWRVWSVSIASAGINAVWKYLTKTK